MSRLKDKKDMVFKFGAGAWNTAMEIKESHRKILDVWPAALAAGSSVD